MNLTRKSTIWQRWKAGISMSAIAKEIAKPPATVFSYLWYHGGIEPRKRSRAKNSLSLCERESISRGLASGQSMRAIAVKLGRSPSTIFREVARNRGAVRYRAVDAEKEAWKRAKRQKPLLLASNIELKKLVTSKLLEDWSPEQISGWLKIQFPDDESLRVSHETIYRSLFIQTRGLFQKEMRKHLRTKRKFRHSKNHRTGTRGRIVNGVSISERPAEVEDRAVPGHWEGDLIAGSLNSYIATVVERTSRFTILVKVDGKQTDSVVPALAKQMGKLPELLKRSLTWDRGTELASHARFTMATDIDVYFCDPSSPWQRGTNENTNGLLRQYFPKGTCLSNKSQKELDTIAMRLNTRPRKTLGFQTPADKLNDLLR
jgi:IS30 family transposase